MSWLRTWQDRFQPWASPLVSRAFTLARPAQCLLLDSAGAFAALQLGDYVGRREPVMGQRDHRVKPQVGHLVDQLLRVAALLRILGGHDNFRGLLADLFQERVGPPMQ